MALYDSLKTLIREIRTNKTKNGTISYSDEDELSFNMISDETVENSIEEKKKIMEDIDLKSIDASKYISMNSIEEVRVLEHLPLKVLVNNTLYRLNILKGEKSYIVYKSILKDISDREELNTGLLLSVIYDKDITEALSIVKNRLDELGAIEVKTKDRDV